jgi:hypothetical protein
VLDSFCSASHQLRLTTPDCRQSESVSAAARACERGSRIENPKCLSAVAQHSEYVFLQLTKLIIDIRLEKRTFQGVQSILTIKPLDSSVGTIMRSRHIVSGRRVAWLHLGLGQLYRLGVDGTLMGGRTRGVPGGSTPSGGPLFRDGLAGLVGDLATARIGSRVASQSR